LKVIFGPNSPDPYGPQGATAIEVLKRLHDAIARQLFPRKHELNCREVTDPTSEFLLKSLVYYPVDKKLGQPIVGKNPSTFYNFLTSRGRKTKFTIVTKDGERTLNPESMVMKEFTGIPVIHVKSVYLGASRPSTQIDLISMVLRKVIAIDEKKYQEAVTKAMREKGQETILEGDEKMFDIPKEEEVPTIPSGHDVPAFFEPSQFGMCQQGSFGNPLTSLFRPSSGQAVPPQMPGIQTQPGSSIQAPPSLPMVPPGMLSSHQGTQPSQYGQTPFTPPGPSASGQYPQGSGQYLQFPNQGK
jgi:hypothetical protein